ncbi:MAG: hypothetical protein PHH75_05130 [Candidatus Omnitrophica bacterium]|nr:hypothetical protein [Candidatus Omnitrophota bacterium]MDD5574546.1 hypothetical protein [Candidatus Omnitrophota bacterium]
MFTCKEAFGFGWEKMKKHLWFFVGILVSMMVVSGIQNFFSELKNQPAASFFGTLAFWAIGLVLQMGIIRVTLQLHDGAPTGFDQLFADWKLFLKYLAGSILYSLIVLGGLILLIVPGIMWAVRFQFFSYFIIDKNAGPVASLKLSSKATEGVRWDVFWFDLACMGAIILGVLALFIGLFAAIPTVMMATAFVYRKLQLQAAQ